MLCMEERKNITIRLPSSEHKRLMIESIHRNISATRLIRQAIALYIKTYTVEEEESRNKENK